MPEVTESLAWAVREYGWMPMILLVGCYVAVLDYMIRYYSGDVQGAILSVVLAMNGSILIMLYMVYKDVRKVVRTFDKESEIR